MDEATLCATGVQRPLLDQVVTLAQMTREAGLDGVVASAQEAPAIRAACGPDFTIVTPGIRNAAAGARHDDQTRVVGPAAAIQAGASYIVVGRPIIAAADPRAAAEAIVRELEEGIRDRGSGIG
jgi:orotidine-5'-phosphate decarboxylase